MEEFNPPIILCMENSEGQEVALPIEPYDDFQSFLDKAKSLLGYDIDINSVTKNQPVSLKDNIYQFLSNSDLGLDTTDLRGDFGTANTTNKSPGSDNESVYVLDDGTQIKTSQIQFDNEDLIIDLTEEKIPFIKYIDGDDDYEINDTEYENKDYCIIESPISRWSSNNSSPINKPSFINSLPFKLVCNSSSGFEAQFHKYVENNAKSYTNLNTVSNKNKSPRSLITDNYKNIDESNTHNGNVDHISNFTREDILNLFKDPPIAPISYDNTQNFVEKRRHVRKTDPSRPVYKSWNSKPYTNFKSEIVPEIDNQNCFICNKYAGNENLFIFDNNNELKTAILKIICANCLEDNYRIITRNINQGLANDECLVLRNNQQYIYQRIKDFASNIQTNMFNTNLNKDINKINPENDANDKENYTNSSKINPNNIFIEVKDENYYDGSSSDVEIIDESVIELDDNIIDNLEDADEQVKEFLGKYQAGNDVDMKCRFCDRTFADLSEVTDHGEEHKHKADDEEVFPCPICDYGYSNLKWLKAHLIAAHLDPDKSDQSNQKSSKSSEDKEGTSTPNSSKKLEEDKAVLPGLATDQKDDTKTDEPGNIDPDRIIKTEVKQEALDTSDEEAIWIVQADDDEEASREKIQSLFNKNNVKKNKCFGCSVNFPTAEKLAHHKCRRKRHYKEEDDETFIPSEEDFLIRPRKKKRREPTSDPVIVTCHNCNESFTSKVRLKFHMQFHSGSAMLRAPGEYACPVCGGVWRSEAALFDHVHFRHARRRRWPCPVQGCGKTFHLRATLTKHSRMHTDTRRYICVTCGKRFLDKQTLDEHGVTHLQIKPFQCHICMKQLTRRSRLRMHLRAHEEEVSPTLVMVCGHCCRAFPDNEQAEEHAVKSLECIEAFAIKVKEEVDDNSMQLSPTSGMVRNNKVTEPPSNENKKIKLEISDNDQAANMLQSLSEVAKSVIRVVVIEKAFRCEYCEDVFYIEDGLNNHRKIHKGVKNPFTCHICKVSFATYSRCTTHKTTHGFYKRSLADAKRRNDNEDSDEKQVGPNANGILGYGGFPVVKHFLCEDCGRSYLHWTYLQVHRRMKHASSNFLQKCTNCDLTFQNSWSLAYHKKKAHGKIGQDENKPREVYRIPCRDCDQVLPNKTALYRHRKKEHSDMSLRNDTQDFLLNSEAYSCQQCGQTFQQPNMLQNHIKEQHGANRLHTCGECGRGFRTSSVLHEHSRVHTGERPYPCDVCGVAFRRSTAMRNHRLIHTGVRAWACARCPKRFRIRADLRTHLRLKHPALLAVIEIKGLNPSPEEVLACLSANNILKDKVIEISKMSFAKGSTGIVPNSTRALSMMSGVPKTPVAYSRPNIDHYIDEFQPVRRGRGISKTPRRPAILQAGPSPPAPGPAGYPVTINVGTEDMNDIRVELVLNNEEKPLLNQ